MVLEDNFDSGILRGDDSPYETPIPRRGPGSERSRNSCLIWGVALASILTYFLKGTAPGQYLELEALRIVAPDQVVFNPHEFRYARARGELDFPLDRTLVGVFGDSTTSVAHDFDAHNEEGTYPRLLAGALGDSYVVLSRACAGAGVERIDSNASFLRSLVDPRLKLMGDNCVPRQVNDFSHIDHPLNYGVLFTGLVDLRELSRIKDNPDLVRERVSSIYGSYKGVVDRVMSYGARPICVTLPVLPGEESELVRTEIVNMNKFIIQYASEKGAPVIDVATLFSPGGEYSSRDYFTLDKRHFSKKGHEVIAGELMPLFKKE